MQTFLPYPSFEESAKVLDYRRLGKQRVEAMQCVNAIERRNGWSRHPLVSMWKYYVDALKVYFNVISREWIRRGYRHNIGFYEVPALVEYPWWLGKEALHCSHRSALLYKDYEYYSKFGWLEVPEVDYVWFGV